MRSEQKDLLEAWYGEQAHEYRPSTSLTEFDLPELIRIDISSEDISKLRGIFIDISLERVKMIVQNHLELMMEVERLQSTITTIKNSRFWKIRQGLSKIKQITGL